MFDCLEPLTPLSSEIRRCILSEDEFSDDASTGLKQIRREIRLANERIHSGLNSIINGSARTYLQEAIITLRGDRYCVPVKAEYKSQIAGIVHDRSSSGSTLFIEPAKIVELNNNLRELLLKERAEIEKILSAVTMAAAEYTEQLTTNQEMLTKLDFIFAKGLIALEQNATKPIFREKNKYTPKINIRKGRHPLIPKEKAVPIDIRLGEDFDLLIVTGPNTGGKTVSLKTLGLLTLMGQAGLHIPALDRSELSVFTGVFADIGDEQSIEQSLSTFSSHMTKIISILEEADERSLCLFDELGAGTDPAEGAALGIAILSYLHERGVRTMATTHYSELKLYAIAADRVENACCEFDIETLRPTYRLLTGIPGKSNAFAISAKLGLPEHIINAAREKISEDKARFEDVAAELETSRKTIEFERLEITEHKARIKTLEEQLKAKREKIEQSKERILREAEEQAREILREAKQVADETIKTFQKSGGVSIKEMEEKRQTVGAKINEKNKKLLLKSDKDTKKVLNPSEIKIGDNVKILSMGLKGTVATLPDAKGNIFVQCGVLRSQVNVKDLERSDASGNQEKKIRQTESYSFINNLSKASEISAEINLHGKTVDEAMQELEKYLDDAYLSHLPSVRIVHGKGTGTLRRAVQEYLKKLVYIESFRLGEYGEGDTGVTVAVFK